MRFGPVPVAEAEGAVLAHGRRVGSAVFKKGRVLSASDVAALTAANVGEVVVARLEPDDVSEDAAAAGLAAAIAGPGLTVSAAFTGRANLFAAAPGVVQIDRQGVNAFNAVDESITLATLQPFDLVAARDMVATLKIIPYAVTASVVSQCRQLAASRPLLRLAPLRGRPCGLVHTITPGFKRSLIGSTSSVMRARLTALASTLADERECPHEPNALAAALTAMAVGPADILMVVGASAIIDRRDVIPAAIEQAGGTIVHCGMPVDPGNLLLLGRISGKPVLGLPGCARSPKLNGFDWILWRLLCDLPVERADVMGMGVGGLLKEIPTRPLPRADATAVAGPSGTPRAASIAAIVLAAGSAKRMGRNKLVEELGGAPLVRRAVETALASQARPVVVVTGPAGLPEAERVRAVLADLAVVHVPCPDAASGMSASLRAGLAALPEGVDAAIVMLGDMPYVRAETVDKLAAAFNPGEGRAICVPTSAGQRGNPILWARRYFAAMAQVEGDAGARGLLLSEAESTCEVETGDPGILKDIDTLEALEAARHALEQQTSGATRDVPAV
ncbi:MAG: molybdopterin-binding/glycosyltransferase family 2 protein [Alphaproteobacteria bacterium]|nr:molybdopterin-binding/glycosyltransferase family 2 protein [Alphaproteobacteria bacterium]